MTGIEFVADAVFLDVLVVSAGHTSFGNVK